MGWVVDCWLGIFGGGLFRIVCGVGGLCLFFWGYSLSVWSVVGFFLLVFSCSVFLGFGFFGVCVFISVCFLVDVCSWGFGELGYLVFIV